MTAMNITIQSSFLPHTDPDASLAFYRDVLGFEVRLDVGYEDMRWITVGPAGQPDTAIVLHPPTASPGLTEEEKQMLLELVAKGSYFGVNLTTPDLDATFAALEAKGAEIVQEPIVQDWGARDCAFRDPAGNMIRMAEQK
jgi:catechol 2,3-dioxygenase-like lactoylglutathione lyase family enzyme